MPEEIVVRKTLNEVIKLVALIPVKMVEAWAFYLLPDLSQICKLGDDMKYREYWRHNIRPEALYSSGSQGARSSVSMLPAALREEPPAHKHSSCLLHLVVQSLISSSVPKLKFFSSGRALLGLLHFRHNPSPPPQV